MSATNHATDAETRLKSALQCAYTDGQGYRIAECFVQDVDALLASLRRDEHRARRGRLKIFFGMCPGVGKTYAMLAAAQAALREALR
jgi:hypothetical protein